MLEPAYLSLDLVLLRLRSGVIVVGTDGLRVFTESCKEAFCVLLAVLKRSELVVELSEQLCCLS